ncbi:metal ABC transporter permease [Nocardioides cavernaquae]|uniref:Metal ABC transporter permease n=1 Tax=Nocardioides cavernaquae TaxID=2321396 RepID=A0A3A5HDL5_9ACTN|nr:metal ABC transporter permease [Nocardioides cavernaquae]RJS47605.1 metal ABC transporter permease [Nocardioides cavernaquae]
MSLLEMFTYPFMVKALIAAFFSGLASPAIGTYLVQKRLSLMGDGIGHVAVTGVALGLLTGASPTWTAVAVAILGAVTIELIRERGNTNGDLALALLFYGGIAAGLMITGIAGQSAQTLNSFLFGGLLSINWGDVFVTIVLASVVLLLCIGLGPQLFAVAQDAEFARVAGLRVRFYNLLVAVLAAVTVTVAMRTVGLLLVSALMVVPVATAQQVTRSFRTTLAAAMGLGVFAALAGLIISAYVSSTVTVQSGPSIVLVALGCFVLAWPTGSLLRRRQRLREPFAPLAPLGHEISDEHPHQHGDDCGHPAIPHGDHVDYVHNGHRHAAHGEHYDEH